MLLPFLHFAGIIIGLGAVTVIDTMGFISRKSKKWTKTTIEAHHVTKPLIWLGTLLMATSWIFIYSGSILDIIKSVLIVLLILNGSFLSFYISPRLDLELRKKRLLPLGLQVPITFSMIVSFICWWSLVFITLKNFGN